MHTDANGDVRFVNTWVTPQVGDGAGGDEESQSQSVGSSPITGVEYLVIGGGGSPYNDPSYMEGGGGGAGAYRSYTINSAESTEDSSFDISTSYILVGAGGEVAMNGQESILDNIISYIKERYYHLLRENSKHHINTPTVLVIRSIEVTFPTSSANVCVYAKC